MAWEVAAGLIGAGASIYGGQQANQANASLAQDQMDFQQRMSNTAHRREVADLRAAGLNPILSATKGQGASTPPGATAKMENIAAPAVSTALQGLNMKREMLQAESQIALNSAMKTRESATALKEAATAKQTTKATEIMEATMGDVISEAAAKGGRARDYSANKAFYDTVNKINEVVPAVNAAGGLLQNLLPKIPIKGGNSPQKTKWPNADEMRETKRQNQLKDAEKLFLP